VKIGEAGEVLAFMLPKWEFLKFKMHEKALCSCNIFVFFEFCFCGFFKVFFVFLDVLGFP
jgi:hypothetical protein